MLDAGPCDALVNDAGWGDQREWRLQHQATQRAEMELNYWGAVNMTRALLSAFIARGAGHIVNVSSIDDGASQSAQSFPPPLRGKRGADETR